MTSLLTIDFETRSTVDLKRTGVYPYAQDVSTDVHCAAWAIGDEPVELWKRGEPVPARLAAHVKSGGLLAAWNANFEIAIWTYILTPRHGWPLPAVEQWRCSMVAARGMALPGALANAAGAIGLDIGKDSTGQRIMMAMARPRRPKTGEPKDAVLWREDDESLATLYAYCKTDVEVERGIRSRLVSLRPSEQRLWHLDQKINSRGVPVDVDLAKRSLAIVEAQAIRLDREMAQVTDWEVSACTNINQLKLFLKSKNVVLGSKLDKKTMTFVDTMDKEFVAEALARTDLDPTARRALELRQEAGKASVSKINALLQGLSPNGRACGLLQFNAADTGRWGGRRFQPQNLRRPDEDFDVDGAIETILRYPTAKAMDILDAMFGAPLTCVSNILRGLIKAGPGQKIVAADLANIEGRVLAWLAGESGKLAAFRAYDAGTGPDLYKVMAGSILGKQPQDVTKAERQAQGKVPELACGYQGGVGAFQAMAHTYGLTMTDEEADEIKKAWRLANPRICQLWYDAEAAALEAVDNPGQAIDCGRLRFKVAGSFLWMQLPSGRALCYSYPKIMTLPTPWGEQKDMLTFKTVPNVSNARKIVHADKTNTSRWARIATYGGAIIENATQAAARDVLADGMVRLEAAGYPIILSVHDEAVSEVEEGFGSFEEYEQIMSAVEPWAAGLPVAAAGFEGARYRK